MMHNRARKILASLALLLGIAHMVFGMAVFKTFDLNMLWFLGGGVAIMVSALANFKTGHPWILRGQNTLIFGFITALLTLEQQPQIWLGFILFAGLFVLSCASRGAKLKA